MTASKTLTIIITFFLLTLTGASTMQEKTIYLHIARVNFTSPNNQTATSILNAQLGIFSPLFQDQEIHIPWNKAYQTPSGVILFNDYEVRSTYSSTVHFFSKDDDIKVDKAIKSLYKDLGLDFACPVGNQAQKTDIRLQPNIKLTIQEKAVTGSSWGLKGIMPYFSPISDKELAEQYFAFSSIIFETIPLIAFFFELDDAINGMKYALIPIDYKGLSEEYQYR